MGLAFYRLLKIVGSQLFPKRQRPLGNPRMPLDDIAAKHGRVITASEDGKTARVVDTSDGARSVLSVPSVEELTRKSIT